MLDENRLFKIIDELETHKKLFFAGILQDDEKFIHIIQTLDKQLTEIKSEKLKNKAGRVGNVFSM